MRYTFYLVTWCMYAMLMRLQHYFLLGKGEHVCLCKLLLHEINNKKMNVVHVHVVHLKWCISFTVSMVRGPMKTARKENIDYNTELYIQL